MSHCKNIAGCDQNWKCKKCRAAITAARVRSEGEIAYRSAGPGPGPHPCQKEAVRASERPKSREETPVKGCGGEAVMLETAEFVCPCSR